jgi:hypothetical protein
MQLHHTTRAIIALLVLFTVTNASPTPPKIVDAGEHIACRASICTVEFSYLITDTTSVVGFRPRATPADSGCGCLGCSCVR